MLFRSFPDYFEHPLELVRFTPAGQSAAAAPTGVDTVLERAREFGLPDLYWWVKLIVSRQAVARPFAAPPGVPADRVAALRTALDATMADPDFLAEMRALALEVRPVGGAAVQSLMVDIHASPPEVLALAREILTEKPDAARAGVDPK